LKYIPAKFHQNLISNDGTLRFFKRLLQQEQEQQDE